MMGDGLLSCRHCCQVVKLLRLLGCWPSHCPKTKRHLFSSDGYGSSSSSTLFGVIQLFRYYQRNIMIPVDSTYQFMESQKKNKLIICTSIYSIYIFLFILMYTYTVTYFISVLIYLLIYYILYTILLLYYIL